jgi:hypothetical protein
VRDVEGFPIATDEAIIALSDPPHYTACPNPFLPEIVARWQQERDASADDSYRVDADGTVYDGDTPFSRVGVRKAVLCDLSPAATFIAYNYNTPVDVAAFEREAQRILAEVEQECGWMYETRHSELHQQEQHASAPTAAGSDRD